jgi:hypothetical protein
MYSILGCGGGGSGAAASGGASSAASDGKSKPGGASINCAIPGISLQRLLQGEQSKMRWFGKKVASLSPTAIESTHLFPQV